MKNLLAALILSLMLVSLFAVSAMAEEPVAIKALLLPKFESGELAGDFPGEAQYYYEAYCAGGEEYEIRGGFGENKLYVKDGVALYVTGMGKVNTALSLMAVLNDSRFDFSNAYVISTGCAGSAYEYGVMGDVFVITAAIDYDLGHHADIREMTDPEDTTWFHDASYDSSSYKLLDQELMAKVVTDENGTARHYKIPECGLLAKTGTAQVAINGSYQSGITIASIMAAKLPITERWILMISSRSAECMATTCCAGIDRLHRH